MALWHFLKDGEAFSWSEDGAEVSSFDDGLAFLPDEDGFSREAADAKAQALGTDVTAEYTGTPNWHARVEAEQAKADAEAQINGMLNPPDPKAEQEAAINARFDALLAAAPDRNADIEALRSKALAEI